MLVEGDPLVARANISFLAASTRAKETKAAATEVRKKLFAILAGDAPDREEIAQGGHHRSFHDDGRDDVGSCRSSC